MYKSIRLAVIVISIAPMFTEPAIGQVFEVPGPPETRLSRMQSRLRTIRGGTSGQFYRRTLDGKSAREDAIERAQETREARKRYGVDSFLTDVPTSDTRTIPDWIKMSHATADSVYWKSELPTFLGIMLRKHINQELKTPLSPCEISAILSEFNIILLAPAGRFGDGHPGCGNVLKTLQDLHSPENEKALVRYLEWATDPFYNKYRLLRENNIAMAATALARMWWPEEFYRDQGEMNSLHSSADPSKPGLHLYLHESSTPRLRKGNHLYQGAIENAQQIATFKRSKPSAPPMDSLGGESLLPRERVLE